MNDNIYYMQKNEFYSTCICTLLAGYPFKETTSLKISGLISSQLSSLLVTLSTHSGAELEILALSIASKSASICRHNLSSSDVATHNNYICRNVILRIQNCI